MSADKITPSDTPRTDANEQFVMDNGYSNGGYTDSDFSRQLEIGLAAAMKELAAIRTQLAERDAEIAALKGHAERMMVEIEDLISLAEIAMRAANNDGGEFDGCSELQSARDAISDYRAAYQKE